MDLNRLQYLMECIRYKYEGSLLAATYAACSRCGHGARGGGICGDCATEELGELIGADLASQYQAACKGVKQVTESIYSKIRAEWP